jgi:MFS family permease
VIKEVKFLTHTMLHPFDGFDSVKFDGKGTVGMSLLLAFMFFIQNVIAAAGSGFLFSSGDPDRISVPNIFAISIGTIALWLISNWAVDSLMDAEGRTREIAIVSTYSLLPYIIASIITTFLSNFVTLEILPFLRIIMIVGVAWSALMMFVGMYQIHQLSFGRTVLMMALTVLGMAAIIFLMVLVYSLYQQVYIFLYTIFSELMFRM